nr:DNA polymerase theta-like [Cherax quadricarinatus]
MDLQKEEGCRPRQKFLGRFAISVHSSDVHKGDRSPPLQPVLDETEQVGHDNEYAFGDSFCNLDILDNVRETEAQYADTDSATTSHKEVPSLQTKSNLLHNVKTPSRTAAKESSCSNPTEFFRGTKFQDLRRSPRLKSSYSSNVKKLNSRAVSKEFAESKNDEEQSKNKKGLTVNIVPTSIGMITLEDAMGLNDSDFPDEITSPGDEISKEVGLGHSLLHDSRINNCNIESKPNFSFFNENVRRSQRLQAKNITNNTNMMCVSKRSNFCKVGGSNHSKNKGRNKCVNADLASNLDFNCAKETLDAEVLKEIHINSLLKISSCVEDAPRSKLNYKEINIDFSEENFKNEQCVQNSSGPMRNLEVTKSMSGAKSSFITATKVLKEQGEHLEYARLAKDKDVKSVHNRVMQGSHLELEGRNKENTAPCESLDGCSINRCSEKENKIEKTLINCNKVHSKGKHPDLSDDDNISVGKEKKHSSDLQLEMDAIPDMKSLPYCVKPSMAFGFNAPVTRHCTAPVKFFNPEKCLSPVISVSHLEDQVHVDVSDSKQTQVQFSSVIMGIQTPVGSLSSKNNNIFYEKDTVCNEAHPTVKSDSSSHGSCENTTLNAETPVNSSAAVKYKTPVHQLGTASPKMHKAASILRSPFSENNESHIFLSTQEKMELSSWGLPEAVLECYVKNGIKTMFPWQAECLSMPKVLDGRNLVYSAPTSAGKTLVAELLLLKRVAESGRKGVFILPFVSVAREKMYYLQKMFGIAGIRVEGFMGSHNPPGGLKATDIAVCTIEKANNLVNRLMEDKRLNELSIIVVDELHMLGDSHRGYLLELLLTKVMFVSTHCSLTKKDENGIQIIGMSATLPNLKLLAGWLDSALYNTDFRPVPLTERVKIGRALYDPTMNKVRELDPLLTVKDDSDHLIQLCLETVLEGFSVLVFCPTKAWCEKMAECVAKEFFRIGKADSQYPPELGRKLRDSLDSEGIRRVINALHKCPVGLDDVLSRSISFGAAFHHAGLTFDERDIIEGGFRTGSIRVLIATSTLSSGVNLPARRVIIRSPVFGGTILDTLTYKQMIGRAGRKGVDTEGESILICREGERSKAQVLMSSTLPPITSCLQHDASLTSSMKRAILEVIVSGVATTPDEVDSYCSCTLLAASLRAGDEDSKPNSQNSVVSCIAFLEENEFIRLQEVEGTVRYIGTQLGCAVLASGLSPDEGLHVFSELYRARQCFVLENELHIIYQVRQHVKNLAVHQRFYTALALHDLVHEVPLNTVARKYGATRGILQSLQQTAATFAGMVTVFCNRLGWHNLELLVTQFQDRLHFGIQRELCDLVRLSHVNGQRARELYNAGLETVTLVAHANPLDVENILHSASPFHSNKMRDNGSRPEGTIWLSSSRPLTEAQVAALIVTEARQLVQKELGIASIDWTHKSKGVTTPAKESPTLSCASYSANRRVIIGKRRNSSSPNFILQSSATRVGDSVSSVDVKSGTKGVIAPVGTVKAGKRLSPLALILRRKSKSPRITNDSEKMLLENCMQDQINSETSVPVQLPEEQEDNNVKYTASIEHSHSHMEVPENKGNKHNVIGLATEIIIRTSENDRKDIENVNIDSDLANGNQPRNEDSNNKSHDIDYYTEKKDRKNTQDMIKNETNIVDKDAGKNNNAQNMEIIQNVNIIEHTEIISGNKLPNLCSGNNNSNNSENNSSIAGLLFGRHKTKKKNMEMVNLSKGTKSFVIPESQEDKSDNIFSPKRHKNVKSNFGTLKSTNAAGKFNNEFSGINNPELRNTSYQPCEEIIPEMKDTRAYDNISGIDEDCSKGMNTSTPIGKGCKRSNTLSAKTCITNSGTLMTSAVLQGMMAGDMTQESEPNWNVEDLQNISISCEEEVSKVHESIKRKENSDLFDESSDRDLTVKQSTHSSPIFVNATEMHLKNDIPKPSDFSKNNLYLTAKVNHNIQSFDLSKSLKDGLLKTMDSCDFCSGSENVSFQDVQSKESKRNYEAQTMGTFEVQKSSEEDRQEHIKRFGVHSGNFDQQHLNYTLIPDHTANLKRKLTEYPKVLTENNKKRSPHSNIFSQGFISDKLINYNILKVPAEAENERLCEESVIYQAYSEDFDFSCFNQDKILDNEIDSCRRVQEIISLDGSYLQSVSQQKNLLRNASHETCEDRSQVNNDSSPSVYDKEGSTSQNQSVEELNQNICEDLELNENTNINNETIFESFPDQAFETHLHWLSSNEDLVDGQNEAAEQGKRESTSDQLKENSSNCDKSEYKNSENSLTDFQDNNSTGEDNTNVKGLGTTFTQLDITPGTEALLDGQPNENLDTTLKNDSQPHSDNQVSPVQPIESRLSSDMFSSPVSPLAIQCCKKTNDVKSAVTTDRVNNVSLKNKLNCQGAITVGESLHSENKYEKIDPQMNSIVEDASTSNNISPMTNSFCIIDVVNDSVLFESFLREWSEQRLYAIGLACENTPAQQSKGGIGWRIAAHGRTPRRGHRHQEVAGVVVENSKLLIVGIAVCWEGRDAYYINLRTLQEENFSSSLPTPPLREAVPFEHRVASIKNFILKGSDKNPVMRVWDAKNCVRLLAAAGLGFVTCPVEDPRVASWMLDPGGKEFNICNLVMKHSLENLPLLEGVGSSLGLSSLGVNTNNPGSCRVRAATESVAVYHLMTALKVQLENLGMLRAFKDVEMPSVVTLACMELSGMGFSNRECEAQKAVMQAQMSSLEKKAYCVVGHPFSLASSNEISNVLYGELHLPSPTGPLTPTRGRKGRGGIGSRGKRLSGPTNKEALEKLSKIHPLPAVITQWRKINSSLNKVVFPLQEARVHCSRLSMDRIHPLTHTFTATGRVTMHEPNLQNIPKDFNIQVTSDKARSGISTSVQHRTLINSAIMTQLAPLLVCKKLYFLYDIFIAVVVKEVNVRVSRKDVGLKDNESQSTVIPVGLLYIFSPICYGLIYGMGTQALSEQLGVGEDEALSFMENFKGSFPGVKQFIQNTIEKSCKEGYVLTLMGRRRYLPNITSKDLCARAQSERQAVNTAIQGSAADIVKLAMVRINTAIRQAFPTAPAFLTQPTKSREDISGGFLVLQLHDELMYEVVSEDVIQVAQLVQSHMEGVQQLAVSLPVNIKVGPSWGAMQTLNL